MGDVALVRTRAERVIVVSIMKSGTHLIQELMVALGYGMYGQSRITPEIRPVLGRETRLEIARMVYGEAVAIDLEAAPERELVARTDQAWEAYGWAWQLRFGLPLANRYGTALPNSELVRTAYRRTASSQFADTPAGLCWILPELDATKLDGRFLQEWSAGGQPRIILNYRDPRDVVLSMVNFLAGKTTAGYGNFSEFRLFSRILDAQQSMDQRLTYALTDPAFPGYHSYRQALWLLNHPDVCKVRFEELVGPEGGGSTEEQRRAVTRILAFLDVDEAPERFLDRLYRTDAFSFYKGQIGGWRKAFSPMHERLFADRFPHILSAYGYE
jgi:hypothetical protein